MYKKGYTMTEKTKNIITEVIRWIAFVPVVFICFVIGYSGGISLLQFISKIIKIKLAFPLVIYIIVGAAGIFGARLLVPKHKVLATILAVVLWALFVGTIVYVTYMYTQEMRAILCENNPC